MTIDTTTLSAVALNYASAMTSIRGRRVQRLVMREFARYDAVVHAKTESGQSALLGLSSSGEAALLASDGRGKEIEVVTWDGTTETVKRRRFDLLKDSLPVLGEENHDIADLGAVANVTLGDATRQQKALFKRLVKPRS